MDVPFELQIALRYLLAKRKQAFISVISFISTLGVTVGVMALVVALALMTGLQQELRDRIVGSNPHIYVWNTKGIDDYRAEADKLRAVPHVLGAAPAIQGQGLLSAGDTQPVQIKGIDPVLEQQVTNLRESITSGSIEALNTPEGELPGILLGKELAAKLGVTTGDSVSLTMGVTLTPAGLLPRTRRLHVVGLFSLGLIEFDQTYGFLSLDVAKRLLGKEKVDLIQLRVDDIFAAPRIAQSIPERLGAQYVTQDWADMNKSLFSALGLEKMAISLTIGLIVMVAALNIVASLILLVMEKHRDIAHPEDDGGERQQRDDDLHDAGADHRPGRHGGGRLGRLRGVDGADPLSADQGAGGRLPDVVHAVPRAAARLRARGDRRDPGLLHRDDLSVAPGSEVRSGAGVAI